MREYEADCTMPVASEVAFDIVSRPELIDRWVPSVHVDARADELPLVHVKDSTAGLSRESDGMMRTDRDRRRLEWGSAGDDRYAGWLQVNDTGPGSSEVTVHLSIRDDEPAVSSGYDVPGALRDALRRLHDDVMTGAGTAQ